MRNLIAGIGIGIATTLAVGAATSGRYQVAVTYAPDVARLITLRIDTLTGEIESSARPVSFTTGGMKQMEPSR